MGGNIIPDAKSIQLANVANVLTELETILPFQFWVIGSAGQKPVSSDIDILIDQKELLDHFNSISVKESKVLLSKYFENLGYTAKRSGVSVHIGIPQNEDGDIVQIDIMVVKNAEKAAPLHQHDYSDDVEMKGGTLHKMWADLTNLRSTDERNMMMSPYIGILNRETREVIADTKEEIAKILIDEEATTDDMSSVTKFLTAMERHPIEREVLVQKYITENE